MTDMVNHPAHYESHPVIKGECWDYAKHLCNGAEFSAFRYAWRYADKFNPLEDLNKAGWYLDRLIAGGRDNKVRRPPPHRQGRASRRRRCPRERLGRLHRHHAGGVRAPWLGQCPHCGNAG